MERDTALGLVENLAIEPRLRAIGCETIYAFIYRTAQKAEALWRYLTRRQSAVSQRHARPSRDAIKDRASIHDRPETIESRGEAGHWEGDLIICKCTRPVLVLHERKSRVTLAARLTGKTAAETISAMLAVFGHIGSRPRNSRSWSRPMIRRRERAPTDDGRATGDGRGEALS